MAVRGTRRRWPALLVVAAVLTVGLVFAAIALWLRPPSGEQVGRDTAAAVLGVRPDDVFMTEDGALSVVSEGGLLSLVLLQPSGDGTPEPLVLGSTELDGATLLRGHEERDARSPTARGGTILARPNSGSSEPGTSSAAASAQGR